MAWVTFALAEKLQEPSELAHAQPFDFVHRVVQLRTRFAGEGSRDQFLHTGAPGRLREEKRISVIPGDDSERVRRLHSDDGTRRGRDFVSDAGA